MSRRTRGGGGGEVRGPNSALSEFLRSRGISAQGILERNAARIREAEEAAAAAAETGGATASTTVTTTATRATRATRRTTTTLSTVATATESEPAVTETPAPGPSTTKKKNSKKRKKAGSDDEGIDDDFNPYRKSKPVPGQISFCEECNCRFTVTPYSKPGPDGEGLLCTPCGRKTATADKEAKKKKYTVRKNRKQTNKLLLDGENGGVKSLTDLCVAVVAKHIDDVPALGDIGQVNMDKICQIISRNRSLNDVTMKLFLEPGNTRLHFYDSSKIGANELRAIAAIVPTLRYLSLQFCGQITDEVMDYYSTQLTDLRGLALGGPFLVTKECYASFFKHRGSKLEIFELSDTFRFNAETTSALVDNCPNLTELRLRSVTRIDDESIRLLTGLTNLKVLEISEPEMDITDDSIVDLLNSVGSGLRELNLNKCSLLTDRTILAIKACCPNLVTLSLEELELVTDAGIASLFTDWTINPGLQHINLSRIIDLSMYGALAMLDHSSKTIENLNLNSCNIKDGVWEELEKERGRYRMERLRCLDVGFVRSMTDVVVEMLTGDKGIAPNLEEMRVWGDHRITETVRLPGKLRFVGREADLH